MNDRYLFRGQTIDTKEWVYGYLLPKFDGVYIDLCESFEKDGFTSLNVFKVIPETVGLWTTLKDKNGKLIFENDVVRYTYLPGEGYWNFDQFAIIEWKNTGFYFNCFKSIIGAMKQCWLISLPGAFPKESQNLFEVIGNIHENTELLGGK